MSLSISVMQSAHPCATELVLNDRQIDSYDLVHFHVSSATAQVSASARRCTRSLIQDLTNDVQCGSGADERAETHVDIE